MDCKAAGGRVVNWPGALLGNLDVDGEEGTENAPSFLRVPCVGFIIGEGRVFPGNDWRFGPVLPCGEVY